VDDSSTMDQEQASLAASLPDLVQALVTPPDEDGDGRPEWDSVQSLHVGVVSSDMGTAGYAVPTCDDSELGEDGILQQSPSPAVPGCDATYPLFLTSDNGEPDPGFPRDFACIATLGTGGCEFEQPLAAVEKALTVHSAAGAANDTFLRADALLAIVLVSCPRRSSRGRGQAPG